MVQTGNEKCKNANLIETGNQGLKGKMAKMGAIEKNCKKG